MAETDPLLKHGDNDDDDGVATNPFQTESSSTPGPSGEDIPLTMMNRESEKWPSTAETSFIESTSRRRIQLNSDSLKIQVANSKLEEVYPDY